MEQHELALISRALQKDQIAQKQLYQHCYGAMHKVVQRYVPDDDKISIVLNDAMLKVFKNLAQYKNEGKFLAWVKQIVVHTCIDYVRVKANMRQVAEIDESTIQEHAIAPDVLAQIDGEAVRLLIQQLPTKLATVFNLYVYEEYDHNEIATQLQIPAGTSRYYLSEAKKQLKQIIENNFFSLNKTAILS